jgi:capsular exopolysaccharide synthesis family protein
MISDIEKRALTASKTIAELDELKLRAEETRALLRQVRDEITSIGVESNAPARVKLASPATVPLFPHGGRRMQLAFLTVMFALSMSMGAGFVLELSDQQVRGPHDVSAVTTQPILAAVPHATVEHLPKTQPLATIAFDKPATAMANEFRRLVARLAYSDIDLVEVNSCLITSPTVGDGKTTVACNLALSLAEANRRVLLMDTAPGHKIERIFGIEPGRGLSESILGGDLRDLVRPAQFRNLYVLGAGRHSATLSTKLASREMVELLEQCEQQFDHVIIDSPPTLLFSDAKCLAPIVDGVVLIVGAYKSTSGMVHRAVADLSQTGSTLLGIVVNGIKPSWGGYLARNVRLFYGNFGRGSGSKNVSDLLVGTTEVDAAEVCETTIEATEADGTPERASDVKTVDAPQQQ